MSVCLQEKLPHISYGELTDLEAIGEGGFGVAYRAKHAEFGTVVYKELNAGKLGERYSRSCSELITIIIRSINKKAPQGE